MPQQSLHCKSLALVVWCEPDTHPSPDWRQRVEAALDPLAVQFLGEANSPHTATVDELPALLADLAGTSNQPVLLLHVHTRVPHDGVVRLLHAAQLPAIGVVNTLDVADFTVDKDNPPDLDTLDAAVFSLGLRQVYDSRRLSYGCLLLSAQACKRLDDAAAGLDAHALQAHLSAAGLRVVTADHLVTSSPAGRIMEGPDPALTGLRRRWNGLQDKDATEELARPGLGRRPVLLHITHSWGGGILRWLDDICQTDRCHDHLVLTATGDWNQHDFGRCFELHLGRPGGWLIDSIPLPASNASVSRCNAAYAGLLQSIVGRFAVDAIIVSSLIGHALDALRVGCPTVMVLHDFFPVCPALNIYFNEVCQQCDRERLGKCLVENPHNHYFDDHSAAGWLDVRQALADTLRSNPVALVAPSKFVAESFRRLTPGMETFPIEEIPHGIARLQPLPTPPHRDRLRLLVPGRLNRAKGIALLEQLLPGLTEFAEVYLLGCGNSVVHRFLGRSGVHVQVDYPRKDLPVLLAQIAPDAALLLSEVPETFSYVLSELNALEIPALARRRGSFAERIRSSENGLLLDDQASTWLDHLAALAKNRGLLVKIRSVLKEQASRGITAMVADYNRLLPQQTSAELKYRVAYAATETFRHHALEHDLKAASNRTHVLQQALNHARTESRQRGSWGHRLQVQLDQRTQWALSLKTDLQSTRQRAGALSTELDERTSWAQKLSAEMQEQTRYSGFLNDQLEEQKTRVAALAEQEQRTANWASRVTRERAELSRDLARVREVRDTVINSYSWRIMRPVRVVNRALRRQFFRISGALKPAFSMPGRLALSLRTRGLRGTGARLSEEFRRREDTSPAPPTAEQRVATADPGALEPLTLPCTPDTPEVSIIIPVYNQWHHTYACLESIARHAGPARLEVLVVDDGSSDATSEMLQGISGIKILVNEENLGFIGTCNRGAQAAQGRYLVFLNNDTAVTDGWLEAMIESFTQFDDVGLVGAKLVYPDGTLQEAGGIVFSNGTAWNYGRGMDPRAPCFDFARDADYCSGACLMIERALFNDLGGFDPHYCPAYYEDTDLAFKVRALGKRVIYQAGAEIIHYEGASCGTDTQSGAKRYQVINREKFLDRWREELATQPTALEDLDPMPELPDFNVEAAANHRCSKHALIIDATTPMPDHDSGSVRMLNLMRLLQSLGYRVSFLPDNLAWQEGYTRHLQRQGIEVLCLPAITQAEDYLRQHGAGLDVVILSRHYVASKHLPAVRHHASRASVLFDTVDLHYLRERRLAELKNDRLLHATAKRTMEAELAVARASDMTLVVSPAEVKVLAEEAPDVRAAVLSNIHVVHGCKKPFSERQDILFIGGYQHPPNVDAVLWFVREIWPDIRRRLPQCTFHVIGSKAPKSIRALRAEGVKVHGYVADIEPFLDGCRLSVAPLRYGAGVKGKVNMSMSHGQPVVATPIAVEGMYVTPGCEAMVAEDPADFADAVVSAYTDEAQWQVLSKNGLKNVYQYFSEDAAKAALRQILTHRP